MEMIDLRGLDSVGSMLVLMGVGFSFEPVQTDGDVAKEKENS